jgi:hypothetical protein
VDISAEDVIPDVHVRFTTDDNTSLPPLVTLSVAVDLSDEAGLVGTMVHKYDIESTPDVSFRVTGRERIRLYQVAKNQCEGRRLSPVLRKLTTFDHVLKMSPSSDKLYTLVEPLKRSVKLYQCSADTVTKWKLMLGRVTQMRFRYFAKSSDKLDWLTMEYGIGGELESEMI